jgi:hypothetical protein
VPQKPLEARSTQVLVLEVLLKIKAQPAPVFFKTSRKKNFENPEKFFSEP